MAGSGAASTEAMRAFWDARARDSAMWFIDSRLDYRRPDEAEFWSGGEDVLERSLAMFDLSLDPQDRVLDVGCGIGRVTRAFASRVHEVVGLDVSEEMVQRGRAALADVPNASLVLGNGHDLGQFDDACFDGVYSFVTFQHIPDPAVICAYITEFGRVLRPGGWALFQYSDDPSVHRQPSPGSPRSLRQSAKSALNLAPRGCSEPQWRGANVPREQLEVALQRGGLALQQTVGDGTLFCFVLARRG